MKNKPVILVVDDEPKNNELLEALLVPRGYEIVQAASGEEALAKASSVPDLILLDIMMPKMSGFQVLEKLRANDKTRLIPVVMLTSLRDVEDRIKAMEAGADDFLSKPFEKAELLSRVKSILKISYYRNQLDEKEKFETVIGEMGDGVIVCSPGWAIKELNASAARYLNLAEGKGKDLLDIFFSGFSPSVSREELADSAKLKKVFDIVRPATEQAKAFYLEANIDRIRDPEGKIINIVVSLRDVTENREENRLKSDFLSLISHKMNTPLTVALGYLDELKNDKAEKLSENQSAEVATIHRSISSISQLIGRLIFFVSAEQQRSQKSKVSAALGPAIEKCRKQVLETYPEKKINFSNDLPGGLPRLLIGEKELDTLLFELADNAVKFNDKQDIKIQVSCKTEPPGYVSICFSDNGTGISSENYEKIFDRFYQAEKSFTGQVSGLGLGLPLAKKLVETAGGKMWAESDGPGKGLRICFTLPK